MPAAGDPVYASDVLRAKPTIIDDAATGTLTGANTDVDIPGISISFTTETAGATVSATWFVQAQNTSGTPAAAINARARITGPSSYVSVSAQYAIWRSGGAVTDQGTPGNQYTFTLGAAGLYTATLRGTTVANSTFNVYSTLRCIIQEQWS
jgi:hypothetical protein